MCTGRPEIPRCSSLGEIRRFENTYIALLTWKQEEITANTVCLPPCSYMKYKVLSTPTMSPHFGIALQYAARDLTVVKEVGSHFKTNHQELLYPFTSFLAEFGGALGLFLGFSFVMAWDLILSILHCCNIKS